MIAKIVSTQIGTVISQTILRVVLRLTFAEVYVKLIKNEKCIKTLTGKISIELELITELNLTCVWAVSFEFITAKITCSGKVSNHLWCVCWYNFMKLLFVATVVAGLSSHTQIIVPLNLMTRMTLPSRQFTLQ